MALRKFCCLLLMLFVAAVLAAQTPSGTYVFVQDSDGSTPDEGAVLSLTFTGSSVSFAGTGAENISDSGNCSFSAGRVTLSLPNLGKSVSNQPYTLTGVTLTLPFKVFSDGSGSSTWITQAEAQRRQHQQQQTSSGSHSSGSSGSHASTGNGTGGHNGSDGSNSNSNGSNANGSNGNSNGNDSSGNNDGNNSDNPNAPSPNGKAPDTPGRHYAPKQGNKDPNNWQNSKYAPYVGDWVGVGWGWEVRFKSSDMGSNPGGGHDMMTLTVRHLTRFEYTVDRNGQIKGDGTITYDLDPNLCGVYRAAQQVNMAIDVLKSINEAPEKMKAIVEKANDLFSVKTLREATELEGQVSKAFDSIKDEAKDRAKKAAIEELKSSLGMNAEDTADLAKNVAYQRCMQNVKVVLFDRMVCDDLKKGKDTEVDSAGSAVVAAAQQNAAYGKGEADLAAEYWNKTVGQIRPPDQWIDQAKSAIGKKTIETLNVFDIQEQPGKDACAGIPPNSRGGSSFNTPTMASLMDSWKETAVKLAKAGASGNVPGAMGAATELIMNAPGVTKVQYDYKGLANGPETRRFKIKGHIEGGKVYLEQDGPVYAGSKDLPVEYTVNMVKTRASFPAFTPFMQESGDLHAAGKMPLLERKTITCNEKPAAGTPTKHGPAAPCKPHEELVTTETTSSMPFAMFHKTGEHRNNVKPWHEYEYYWRAQQVTAPLPE